MASPRHTPGAARTAALLALLVVIGTLVHAGGLSGAFLFDDIAAIVDNAHVRRLWPPSWPLGAPPDTAVAGRPVVALSLALDHAAWDLDPRGYHASNLAVHLACALALYGCVRRTLAGPAFGGRLSGAAAPLAWSVALLWLVHPLNIEPVAYVVQRTESVMALLYLLTLYAAIRAAEPGPRRAAWAAAAIVACALGMASKESMVTAPLAVVLYDLAYGAGSPRARPRRRLALWAALAGTWVVLAPLLLGGARARSVGWDLGVGALQYAANQCRIVLGYVRLALWPAPLRFDYGYALPLAPAEVWPQATALAALGLLAAVAFVRRPRVAFPAVWFFVTLAPTSSIVPIVTEVGAERRMYLPSMGLAALAVAAVWAGARAALRRGGAGTDAVRRAALATAVLAVVLAAPLAALTVRRHADYRSAESIWRSAVAAAPRNSRAHVGLGRALQLGGQLDEALRHYRLALDLDPADAQARFNLGTALAERGRHEEAIEAYRRALELQPAHAQAQNNLGSELANRGRLDEALVRFERAVALAPELVTARHNLGRALRLAGRPREALEQLREAQRLAPDRADVSAEAAWILATTPDDALRDPQRALQLARRVVEQTGGRSALMLDTLAAALAAAGRFDEAAGAARRALALAAGGESDVAPERVRERLERYYLRGRPYREGPRAGSSLPPAVSSGQEDRH